MWQYNYNNESTPFGDELMHYGVPGMKWKDHVYATAAGAYAGADLTYKDLKAGAKQYKNAVTAQKQTKALVKATEAKGIADRDNTYYIGYNRKDIAKMRGEKAKEYAEAGNNRKAIKKAAKAYDDYKEATSLKGRAKAVAKVHHQRKQTAKARRTAIRTASKGAKAAAYADLGITKVKQRIPKK